MTDLQPHELPAMLSDPADPPPAPPGLTHRGAALWTAVVARYELRIDDLIVLAESARVLELVDVLAGQLAKAESWVVKGSMGQPAPHPLLGELRSARVLLASLLRQLKLPDEIEDSTPVVETPTSIRARHASNARWNQERARNAAARAGGR